MRSGYARRSGPGVKASGARSLIDPARPVPVGPGWLTFRAPADHPIGRARGRAGATTPFHTDARSLPVLPPASKPLPVVNSAPSDFFEGLRGLASRTEHRGRF